MSTEPGANKELNRILGVLKQTARLAQDATLSGAYAGGEKRCIRQHNSVLNRLQELEVIPAEGFFLPLEDDASFAEIGVACSQLAGYLKDRDVIGILTATARLAEDATHSGAYEGGEHRCIQQFNLFLDGFHKTGFIPAGFFPPLEEGASFGEIGIAYSHLAAYLKNGGEDESDSLLKDLKDLRDLGTKIRQAMPDFLKPAQVSTPAQPAQPAQPAHPANASNVNVDNQHAVDTDRNAELPISERMRVLSEQLRQGNLSSEELQRIAEELRALGDLQTRSTTEE